MTYRLTSLASCGEAESIFADMLVEITHDDDDVLGEYRDILAEKKKNPDEKNMTLPI